jgi:hypothetical protein
MIRPLTWVFYQRLDADGPHLYPRRSTQMANCLKEAGQEAR